MDGELSNAPLGTTVLIQIPDGHASRTKTVFFVPIELLCSARAKARGVDHQR